MKINESLIKHTQKGDLESVFNKLFQWKVTMTYLKQDMLLNKVMAPVMQILILDSQTAN